MPLMCSVLSTNDLLLYHYDGQGFTIFHSEDSGSLVVKDQSLIHRKLVNGKLDDERNQRSWQNHLKIGRRPLFPYNLAVQIGPGLCVARSKQR